MLLKKAGMIVLGTAAGVAALSGTAFAGEASATPSSHDHGHSWDRDHGHGHNHGDRDRDRGDRGGNVRVTDNSVRYNDESLNVSDNDASPSATNGDQGFFGDQTGLVNLGNTNVQAPISAVVGLLGSQTF